MLCLQFIKRRRYDVSPTGFDSQTDASPTVDGQFKDAVQAVVPSEDEKARKRRNREEIGNLYSSYRRVKYYHSQKDLRLMPDLEQAYLSMLKCSNGCASVQRVAAELIPRYALYCPTALEAASRVTIQIADWSSSVALRGEDVDGIAFETAEACLLGLVDISCAAISVMSNLAMVFQSVLLHFIQQLNGRDIYNFGEPEMERLQGSKECFSEMKQKMVQRDDSIVEKLYKIITLSLVRIFVCCPEGMLAAGLELLGSKDKEIRKGGQFFLRLVMGQYSAKDFNCLSLRQSDGISLHSKLAEDGFKVMENYEKRPVSDHSSDGDSCVA